jgi:trehalose/maltose hydrolase-like predicted phosphorylase
MQAIRSIYLQKLLEAELQDQATQQDIDELKNSVYQLTLQLKTEVKAQLELKKVIRVLSGENKRQAKVLDDAAAATLLDEERDTFEKSMERRLQYISRCSSIPRCSFFTRHIPRLLSTMNGASLESSKVY